VEDETLAAPNQNYL